MQLRQVIIAHKAGDRLAQRWANSCARELEALGVQVLLGPSGPKDNPYPVFLASISQPIDLVVVVGGDGTVLGAARQLAPENIPILAINVGGHLGFLTESPSVVKTTEEIWERLQGDRFAIQRRMMLQATIHEGSRSNIEPVGEAYLALNELCIRPAAADRMITSILEMEIDGEVIDQYQGDGLLIATPTGSTCYTVAANGPIVHPGMDAIIITPICPLSLSSRPIVLPPGCVVSIWPLADPDLNTKLWNDGVLGTALWPGQRVDVRIANCQAQFVILQEEYSYYRTLREKLHWAGSRIAHVNSHRN
jgi:NAD+ kinase